MAAGDTTELFTVGDPEASAGNPRRKNFIIFTSIILFLLGVGGYFFYKKYSQPTEVATTPLTAPSQEKSSVLPETTVPKTLDTTPLFGETNFQSESFHIGDIAIGGESEFLLSEDDPAPLEINAIRGEAFTEKNKQEVKLVLSWHTNKLAQSTISYSKGVGQAKKSIDEEDYSLSHSIIIPGLDQASTYVYEITSTDRFGNETTSESHAVYTGSRTVSLFDLIANAVGEVFGWAVKKN